MCVVAVKYIKGYGWCGAKNRDRNYKTTIEVVNSNRNDIQRLYIDDKTTRWTEGINEYGLGIISASFSVKSDEKEGEKVVAQKKKAMVSPDGLSIRNALLLKDPKSAATALIQSELAGATFIFNSNTCYLLEGGYTVKKEAADETNPRKYIYNLKEIKQSDGHCVRTNHGIDLTFLGYSKNAKDPHIARSRKSSESRWEAVNSYLRDNEILDPSDLLDALSQNPHEDTFLNPIRQGDTKKNEMVTTGQLLINAKERVLHYRPIYSSVNFDYTKLNGVKSKTFFEIISSRKLLSFKNYIGK